jgi:hypothetical protein
MIWEPRLYPDVPHYSTEIELSGVVYRFEFYWNGREDRWYFDLRALDSTPIAVGVKIVSNWDSLRTLVHELRPPGIISFVDLKDPNADAPSFVELGRRVRMSYDDGIV